jgi:hypothetical protein
MMKIFLALLLAASAGVSWEIWRGGEVRARATNAERLRTGVALDQLAAENARLSNTVAAASKNSLSSEQFRELLRWRGEIPFLRKAAAEADKLRARNGRLQAWLTNSPESQPPPDPQQIQVRWPKTQLAAAGYADPVSAVETTLFAMTRGDLALLAAGSTPESKSKWSFSDEQVSESAQCISESLAVDSAFDVLGQKSDGEYTEVDVYFEEQGRARKFWMQNISGEWRFKQLDVWPW